MWSLNLWSCFCVLGWAGKIIVNGFSFIMASMMFFRFFGLSTFSGLCVVSNA